MKVRSRSRRRRKIWGRLLIFIVAAGAVIGLLVAPESGKDTRTKVTDTVNDFLKKHNIRLSRKDVEDLVDDIQEVTPEE